MNRKFKSIVSLLLVVLTLMTSFGFTICASAATYENDLPVVLLRGRDRTIYDANGKKIWPMSAEPEDLIMDESDRLLAAFSSSLVAGNWDAYCEELVEVVTEVYSDVVLDENGEASNGSYANAPETPKQKTSGYYLSDYVFNYDARLDPWEVADDLRDYINAVLKATGKKKVQLVSRCLGSNFACAYLTKYKSEAKSKIDTCILYAASAKGTMMISEAFSGQLRFDDELINTYVNEYMDDGEISGLLRALVKVTYQMNALNLGTGAIESVYEQIAAQVVPELILATYGTMPSYWSMVDEDHYDLAKRLIFSGRESEYAGLIKKIDNYHNKVKVNLDSTLTSLNNSGVKMALIAKYNVALPPLFESSEIQADGMVELKSMSFGATAADMGKTLSKSYLDDVNLSGAINYVSDDLIIDSSTGLFPDYTWFIKDCTHSNWSTAVNKLMYKIIHTKAQMTVWDDETYPQYMQIDKDTEKLVPIEAASNSGTIAGGTNILSIITNLLNRILNIFKTLFGSLLK